jgi:hypothetical protein
MIPSTYSNFINEVLYLTNTKKMKWSRTSEDDMFIFKSKEATLTMSYYVDTDAETSYYSFIYSSPHSSIKDGFRVSQYESDFLIMEELFGAVSRSAQQIDQRLTNLLTQIKTDTILNKIQEGEARVAILNNGKRINLGLIRIEGDEVVYFTGKGLRELFKPNMTEEERKKADALKMLSEEEMISEQYISRMKIAEIKDLD